MFLSKDAKEIIAKLDGKRPYGLDIGNGMVYYFEQTLSDDLSFPTIIESNHLYNEEGKDCVRLYTKNIMGYVGVRNGNKSSQLRIYSRFDTGGKDFFIHYMLQRCFCCNIYQDLPYSDNSNSKALNLLQLIFPSYLKQAYQQGIFREYRTFQHNDAHIRGNIDIQRHIQHNVPFQGKIAYSSREYCRNNDLMQLIRHTIEFISRYEWGRTVLRNDSDTMEAVSCVRQYTSDYSSTDRALIIRKNQKPAFHLFYTKYRPLQELCLRILRLEKMGYYMSNNKSEIYGILYDGAILWENYIASVISPMFSHCTSRNSSFNLLSDENGEFQQIVPDYLGINDSGDFVVADAKYIPMDNIRELPSSRAMPIYYKTLMYMLRFKAKQGFLFYPSSVDNNCNSTHKYDIVDTGKTVYLLGLKIPTEKGLTYPDFCKLMRCSEEKFAEIVREKIGPTN